MLGFSQAQLRAIEQAEIAEGVESAGLDDGERASGSRHNPVVYLLALEGSSTPDPSWSFSEKALDSIVQFCQPTPAITHVELFVPKNSAYEDPNFSTYLGCRAGWGRSFGGQRSFYLGRNASLWRAVPVACVDASDRVRAEAVAHEGTPYSLPRYVAAVPPFRALAGMLPEGVGAPAHCATLAARVLQRALPEVAPKHASPWYGPSTLFLELESKSAMAATRRYVETSAFLSSDVAGASCSAYEETRALHSILGGSDEEVAALTDAQAKRAVALLTERASRPDLDPTARRIAQRQLATALLRGSIVRT